ANVMMDVTSRTLKILDFGISRRIDLDATVTLQVSGTPRYMSPEHARLALRYRSSAKPEGPDPRSDVFSVGCVLYELLAFRPAFDADGHLAVLNQILNEDPAPIAKFCPEASGALERIIAKALKKDVAARYQNLGVMRNDLRKGRHVGRHSRTI